MFIAIVPAFNEGKRIINVVKGLTQYVDEVLVVDDASVDDTTILAKKAGAKVICLPINRGQGAALQTGHDYAKEKNADYIIHFDGDGQFDPKDIIPALKYLKEKKADILFGSRFLDGRSNVPWLKKYILLPGSQVVNTFFGLGLSDVHNGFRILTKNAFSQIQITQDRMAHATEIEMETKRLGLNYVEFPVKVVYHEFGQGLKGGISILKDLILHIFIR
jgi:polyprenyl-phospho-N-acetylgalactosaminyl synthase